MTVTADGLPDPDKVVTVSGLVEALRALRFWAGQPSLRRLRAHGGVTTDHARRRIDVLPEATTSYVLRGVRAPSARFVRGFVTACLRARQQEPMEIRAEAERWHRAWLTANGAPSLAGAAAGGAAGGGRPTSARVVVPRQLPPCVADFTGRREQLNSLDRWLPDEGGASTGPVVAAIEGVGGVGKTALAVAWSHRIRHRFPDGQLYLDLQGYARPEPLTATEAVTRLLHGLGVPLARIPANLELASSWYRSLLAETRTLLVLDNAAGADQVRPLLPGGPGCLTLVTSRDRLGGLTARDGARRLVLPPLSPAESRDLIARLLDPDTVAAEPEAVARLGEWCDHLPLALRVAAANIAGTPHAGRVGSYVAMLQRESRLSVLEVPGDSQASVVAAFDLSYLRLPDPARVVFRRLGLFPGHRATEGAVAALAGTTVDRAREALTHLVRCHLLATPSRHEYVGHDLLRLYAAERIRREEPDPDRQAALRRLHRYYLDHVDGASRLLSPGLLRLPAPAGAGPTGGGPTGGRSLTDRAAAVGWFASEGPNLLAVVRNALEAGELSTTCQLADALRGYAVESTHTGEGLSLARLGLAAARATGDRAAQASARYTLGWLYCHQAKFRLAASHGVAAARLSREAGWQEGAAAATGLLGTVQAGLGHLECAVRLFREGLAEAERAGWPGGVQTALANIAQVLLWMGRLPEAVSSAGRALTVAEAARFPPQPNPLRTLAEVEHALGNLAEARRQFESAASAARRVGNQAAEGYAVRGLAELSRDTGDLARAAELAELVADIAAAVEDQRLAAYARMTRASIAPPQEYDRAVGMCRHAYQYAVRTGRTLTQAEALVREAQLHHRQHQPRLARERAGQGLGIARRGGFQLWQGRGLTLLAQIHLSEGRLQPCLAAARRALAIHRRTGHRLGEAETGLTLARAHARAGAGEPAHRDHLSGHQLLSSLGAVEPATLAALPD